MRLPFSAAFLIAHHQRGINQTFPSGEFFASLKNSGESRLVRRRSHVPLVHHHLVAFVIPFITLSEFAEPSPVLEYQ